MNLRIHKGLKVIPTYLINELSSETLKSLTEVGYGLSFPTVYYCQVRIKRSGVTYGCHFNYTDYDTIDEAVDAAIRYSKELLQQLTEQGVLHTTGKGYRNVRFERVVDRRRDTVVYQHVVTYNDPKTGKRRNKIFWHGPEYPTPGQWLHGQHTALYFKFEQLRIGDLHGTCIKHELFNDWKKKRLYWSGHPSVEYDKL